MPIINPGNGATPSPKPVPVQTVDPAYRGVTVDTTVQPVDTLLTHVEGQSWTVNYYSQVLDKDNEISGQQLSRPAANQQYILINHLELKVTQPLTSQQEQDTKSMVMTGVATLYPGVTPNTGDMFLADIGDGREGLFQITNSTRMSVLKRTTFSIEYKMVDYSDSRVGDLNNKVIKETYFVRDYLTVGHNPVIETEEYQLVSQLSERYYDIVKDYFRSFYSKQYATILIPGQSAPTYDPYLMNTLNRFFNTREAPELLYAKQFNVAMDDLFSQDTLWTALLQREKRIVPYCLQEMGLAPSALFRQQGMFEGIYYSNVEYIVYPTTVSQSIDGQLAGREPYSPETFLTETPSRAKDLANLLGVTEPCGLPETCKVLYKPVTVDHYYILSSDFYHQTTEQSALELLVHDYLENRALNNHLLLTLVESIRAMGGLERFYYTPIILLLIKASLRAI